MSTITSRDQAYNVFQCQFGAPLTEIEARYIELKEMYHNALSSADRLIRDYGDLIATYPHLVSVLGRKEDRLRTDYEDLIAEKLRLVNDAYAYLKETLLPAAISSPLTINEKNLLLILRQFRLDNYYFVDPNIPSHKLNRAIDKSKVPSSEKVLALIDCTRLGIAANHILFTTEGMYYREESKKMGSFRYASFPSCAFVIESDVNRISFLNNEAQFTPSAEASLLAYEILNRLKFAISGSIPVPPPSPLTHEVLKAVFDRYLLPGFLVQPNIDRTTQAMAIGQTKLPVNEQVTAVVEAPGDKMLVFGLAGLYLSPSFSCSRILYSEFPDREFSVQGMDLISVGQEQTLTIRSDCIFVICTMLNELRSKIQFVADEAYT